MKLGIFVFSYLLALGSVFVSAEFFMVYLLSLFIYLAITEQIDIRYHRIVVIHPLVIGFSSVLLYSLLEQKETTPFVSYIVMVAFLNIYQYIRGIIAKERKQKEKVDTHFYVKRLVLPAVYPIASYLVFFFLLEGMVATTVYWMIYFFIALFFSKYILTTFYATYFMVIQSATILYIFQYMDAMIWLEKAIVFLFVFVLTMCQYQYAKGGNLHLSFIQSLLGKKIPQPQNGPRIHKGH